MDPGALPVGPIGLPVQLWRLRLVSLGYRSAIDEILEQEVKARKVDQTTVSGNLMDSDPEFRRLAEEQVRQRRQMRKSRGLRDFAE